MVEYKQQVRELTNQTIGGIHHEKGKLLYTDIHCVFTVIGGLLFGIGMCMCLLPEWDAFTPGVVMAVIGSAVLLITFLVRCFVFGDHKMKFNGKTFGKTVFGVFGALVMGVGMCMVMVFDGLMIPGILVGLVGLVLLLCLIPMCVGLK